MAKALLLSILIATIAIPMRNARAKSARAGLKRVVVSMTIYIFVWVAYCVYLFLKLGGGY
jgi:hypothetical protein